MSARFTLARHTHHLHDISDAVSFFSTHRILEAQAELVKLLDASFEGLTKYDFGLKKTAVDPTVEQRVFEGNLPSIKKTKETITKEVAQITKTSMHDTPPKPPMTAAHPAYETAL